MKASEILKKYLADQKLYWSTMKSRSKIHALQRDFSGLYQETHQKARPVFILSTGRCGTMLLTNILKQARELAAVHEPFPELSYHSSLAFSRPFGNSELRTAVDTARYEYIRDAYLLNRRYVETNTRITFFAYYLAELFPESKFLHLVRHPDEFIRSGLSRNWYSNKTLYDEGRIKDDEKFLKFNQAEKIAWLWAATNGFAEEFRQQHGSRCTRLKSEDLFAGNEKVDEVLDFLGIKSISKSVIKKETRFKINKSRERSQQGLDIELEEVEGFQKLKELYGY